MCDFNFKNLPTSSPYQTTNVRMANSNSLHSLAGIGRGNVAETTAGERAIWPAPAGATLPSPAQAGILDGFPWEIPDKGTRQPYISCLPLCLEPFYSATITHATGCKGALAIVKLTSARNNSSDPSCFSFKNRGQLATCHSLLILLVSLFGSTLMLPCVLRYMCGTRVRYLDNKFKNVGHHRGEKKDLFLPKSN